MSARPAVFLDRDGTLIEERAYPARPQDIVPIRGVPDALARLAAAGFLRIVLTNQSGIARGLFTEETLGALHDDLADKLAAAGGRFDDLFYCPHHPEGVAVAYTRACDCRKPGRGLLDLALATHDIDLSRSVLVGDAVRDLLPGVEGVGARVLVRSGHDLDDTSVADHVAASLVEAVDWILAQPELGAVPNRARVASPDASAVTRSDDTALPGDTDTPGA